MINSSNTNLTNNNILILKYALQHIRVLKYIYKKSLNLKGFLILEIVNNIK